MMLPLRVVYDNMDAIVIFYLSVLPMTTQVRMLIETER